MPNDEPARLGMDHKFSNLNYTGDGNFRDHSRKSAIQRLVVDLGAVDLKEASVRVFKLEGLPDAQFVSYLRVANPLPSSDRAKEFEAGAMIFEMSLEDHNSTEIFSEEAPLKNWTCSGSAGAFQSDLHTGNTMFTPESGKSYRIIFKIAKRNLQIPNCQLLFMGGGWRALS